MNCFFAFAKLSIVRRKAAICALWLVAGLMKGIVILGLILLLWCQAVVKVLGSDIPDKLMPLAIWAMIISLLLFLNIFTLCMTKDGRPNFLQRLIFGKCFVKAENSYKEMRLLCKHISQGVHPNDNISADKSK